MDNKKIMPLFLLIAFLIFPVYVSAAKGVVQDAKMCLACHSDKTLSKKLMDKERLPLYIDGHEFAGSVHSKVGCSGCHTDISMDNHPQVKKIMSKKEYVANMSRNCSRCHTPEKLKKKPMHSSLAAKGTCVECHGSHYIKGLAEQKGGVKENQYCLTCHRNKLSMSLKNHESLSVYVDESVLRNSAHRDLQCSGCHTAFSKNLHPVRSFENRRDYTIASSEACRKCHAAAYKQYEVSVHRAGIKVGNLKAPVCSDCHGEHSVSVIKKDRNIGLRSCNKCHADMNNSYEASVHGKARKMGYEKSPVCSSCHNAHNVESTAMTTKIKEGCAKCHKDAGKSHNKWLSNPPITMPSFAAAHFDVVSCAACHSAGAKRGVYLSLFNRRTGKPVTDGELQELLHTDSAGLIGKVDTNGDGSIDAKELWDFFALLYKKGIIAIFQGKMDVSTAKEAHQIGAKTEAVKDCEKCHLPGAELFKNVFVTIKKTDGKPMLLPAKEEVLTSVYSILPVSKFYALGSTSIRLLDILFIIALIGGIAVPIGHISLRIITSPLRALRRMGKGGKK